MALIESTNVPSLARPRPLAWATTLGLVACCGLAAVLLWAAWGWAGGLLALPYPTDPLEGTLLHEARLVRAGEPLYQPLAPDRFVSAPYPPLHPLLLALADSYPGPHTFWSGRLLSFAAILLAGVTIMALVRRVSGSWLAGFVGASLFLTSPPVILWGTRVKPDVLGLLLVAAGLLCACRELEAPGRRWWLAALAAFVLAMFTKQTMVAGPLSAGLAFLVADLRSWRAGERAGLVGRLPLGRRTLAFGLLYWAAVLGIWLAIDLLTGWNYSLHVLGLHPSEWRSLYLVEKYARRFEPYWPLMILAAASLPLVWRNERGLPVVAYGLVAPWTLLGASEIGANHNHMLETALALALAGGCALGWALGLRGRWGALALPALGLAGLQLALLLAPQEIFLPELEPKDSLERYVVFIQNTPGEILADNVGLLLAAGKPIRYDDPSTMGPVATNGVWDQSVLVREINEKRFSAILIPSDIKKDPHDNVGRWTAAMREAMRNSYQLKFRDTIRIYVPKE